MIIIIICEHNHYFVRLVVLLGALHLVGVLKEKFTQRAGEFD